MNLLNNTIKKLIFRQMEGWSRGPVEAQRTRQEKTTRYIRMPAQTHCQPIQANGVPAEWIESEKDDCGVFLYLHGGAYTLGSINTHRELVARLAHAAGLRGLIINYRLAPEHPFPAALEDTISAYQWLLAKSVAQSKIFIAGDSAGGGLALAALIQLRDTGQPQPAGAICLSPWTDLACTGASIHSNSEVDGILDKKSLEKNAALYIGDHDVKNPLISPLYADLKGLPPILIQVGTHEILLDDAVRFSEQARNAGCDLTLEIWEEMYHVFQMFSFLPDTKKALLSIANFVHQHL
jgi:epsilon-lactone hydrolase